MKAKHPRFQPTWNQSVISNVRHKKTWIDAWEVIESEGATTSQKT